MHNGLTQQAQELINAMSSYSPEYTESLRTTLEGAEGMTLRQAIGFMYDTHFANARFVISLPEWTGFWFVDDDNNISCVTHDDEYANTPWFGQFENRTDWVATYRDNGIEQRIRIAKAN